MTLNDSELEIISKEDQILKEVINSLEKQREHYFQRSDIESKRARELTASIVATRRDEEKAALASDEAVSHALEARNQSELQRLKKLIKKPYFARIMLEEEVQNGTKNIEYKIGYAANPDCRIIDWRKAPISKLYYEYKQGEDYCEEILGRERSGKIALKNTIEVENSELKGLSSSAGRFKKIAGEWKKLSSGTHETSDGSAKDRMKDVLALITAEQFRTITEDASSAVLIQGIAGSGKTTVALHRLAWLLEPTNSELESEECMVVVQTTSLRTYVINTLSDLGIESIKVLRFQDWVGSEVLKILPSFANSENKLNYSETPCPASIERLKRSMALLNCIESYDWSSAQGKPYPELLLDILSDPAKIIQHDETKLIDKDLIASARQRTAANISAMRLDYADAAIMLRMHQLSVEKSGNGTIYTKFKHIVIDEVQDASAVDLAVTVNSVEKISGLTIVGDSSQNMQRGSTFPGWDKLRKFWDHKEELSTFMELKVSHRSTLPIMKLADHIQGRILVTQGRDGRVPIWFKCKKESEGIQNCLNWLTTAMEKYPNALTAVLCSDEKQAKFAYNMLTPTFNSAVRLSSNDSFSFEAGIIVSDIKQVKGLEFLNVLLWNPSEENYSKDDDVARNSLYVAVTRAEENLSIVTWNRPSTYLPRFPSNLIRWKIIETEQEE